MAKSIRVSDEMYELASNAGAVLHRSLAEQFEYWARLGAALDAAGISLDEAAQLLQGDSGIKQRVLEQVMAATGAATGAAKRKRRETYSGAVAIEKRKKEFENDVADGRRTASSLSFIDGKRAREATIVGRQPEKAGVGW